LECLLDTTEGGEFTAAVEEARHHGSHIYVVDRPIVTTFWRGLAELGVGSVLVAVKHSAIMAGKLAKLEPHATAEDLQKYQALARSAMDAMPLGKGRAAIGTGFAAIGTERDHYLAHNLWRASNESNTTTVAVVGAAHMKGIEQHFGKTSAAGMEQLGQVPASTKVRVGAFAFAALAAPPAASWLAYEALAEQFSPLVAGGALWLGATAIAAAAAIAYSTGHITLQRLQYETRCGVDLETTILWKRAYMRAQTAAGMRAFEEVHFSQGQHAAEAIDAKQMVLELPGVLEADLLEPVEITNQQADPAFKAATRECDAERTAAVDKFQQIAGRKILLRDREALLSPEEIRSLEDQIGILESHDYIGVDLETAILVKRAIMRAETEAGIRALLDMFKPGNDGATRQELTEQHANLVTKHFGVLEAGVLETFGISNQHATLAMTQWQAHPAFEAAKRECDAEEEGVRRKCLRRRACGGSSPAR
jgi:hypothetical protein